MSADGTGPSFVADQRHLSLAEQDGSWHQISRHLYIFSILVPFSVPSSFVYFWKRSVLSRVIPGEREIWVLSGNRHSLVRERERERARVRERERERDSEKRESTLPPGCRPSFFPTREPTRHTGSVRRGPFWRVGRAEKVTAENLAALGSPSLPRTESVKEGSCGKPAGGTGQRRNKPQRPRGYLLPRGGEGILALISVYTRPPFGTISRKGGTK